VPEIVVVPALSTINGPARQDHQVPLFGRLYYDHTKSYANTAKLDYCPTAGNGSRVGSKRVADDLQYDHWTEGAYGMIAAHIEGNLIVTGALTAGALLQFIAPLPMLRLIYGEAPIDKVTLFLARHWGLLIFLIGGLLIYAAFHPGLRAPAMLLAAIEKIALGLDVFGTSLRSGPVLAAIAAGDSIIALVYVLYSAGF
jgi:hypothetical protein